MKSAILSVGTEILMGQIVNTNATYLSQELNNIGIDVMYHHTVGDNPKRLHETLDIIFHDCDLVITTGGLGPTQDDLTKETIAEYMKDALVLDEESLENLKNSFSNSKRKMTSNNLKQAYLPSRSVIFANPHGTAPGFALENEGKIVICLPGPPREMKEMYQNFAKPFLESKANQKILYKIIKTYGIGESQLETDLLDLIDGQVDPTLATYAKEGGSYLRVASKRDTYEEADMAIEDIMVKVRERIGNHIYSEENEDLQYVVANLLMKNNVTVSSVESITGGLFAKTLTDIPGISSVFNEGIVTYQEEAKIRELGVKQETLDKYSAVSTQIAEEMVEGLYQRTGSDVCISCTGVAGPGSDDRGNPVGLVYIGLKYNGEVKIHEMRMRDAGRVYNRNRVMLKMMHMIYEVVK